MRRGLTLMTGAPLRTVTSGHGAETEGRVRETSQAETGVTPLLCVEEHGGRPPPTPPPQRPEAAGVLPGARGGT